MVTTVCIGVVWCRSVRVKSYFLKCNMVDERSSCKLSLCKIMNMLYLWIRTTSSTRQMQVVTGLFLESICDWTNFFRETCASAVIELPKLEGIQDNPVQIYES